MNVSDTSWSNFVLGQGTTRFDWFVRVFALAFSVRLTWAALARDRVSAVEDNPSNRSRSGMRIAGQILQFLLAIGLFLVAIGVLK